MLIVFAPTEDVIGSIGVFSWPEIAMILSVSSMSYGWIIIRKLVRDKNYSPAMVNGISMFAGGILALVTSFLRIEFTWIIPTKIGFEISFPVTDWGPFFGILTIVIIVSNLICHNLYAGLLKQYSPTFLSFASFLTPLFAAFYGWILLNEKISWPFIVAIIGVCIGLWLFYQDELKNMQPQTDHSIEEVEIEG